MCRHVLLVEDAHARDRLVASLRSFELQEPEAARVDAKVLREIYDERDEELFAEAGCRPDIDQLRVSQFVSAVIETETIWLPIVDWTRPDRAPIVQTQLSPGLPIRA